MHLIFFAFHFHNFSTRPRYFRTWKSSRIIRQSFSNFFSITSSKNDVKNDVESSKNDVISMDKNISQNCLIVYQSNNRISSWVFLWKKSEYLLNILDFEKDSSCLLEGIWTVSHRADRYDSIILIFSKLLFEITWLTIEIKHDWVQFHW